MVASVKSRHKYGRILLVRTTVDIPDPIYREIKARAAKQGRSVKELILQSVAKNLRTEAPTEKPRRKKKYPVLHAKHPGSLKLGPEGVYEYISFP
jgi:hypothetical protein